MTIDLVNDAILPEAETVQLVTRSGDSYDKKGNGVKGKKKTVDIQAEVQPVTGKMLLDLPEGVRESADYMIWTGSVLETDDVIIYEGQNHRVLKQWRRKPDNFTKAAIGRLPK